MPRAMLRPLWCLSVFALTFATLPVAAVEVSAEIKGDTLRWRSAESASGELTSSVWHTSSQLVPANEFVPGGPLIAEMPVKLVGSSGNSVPLTLSLLGMEYNSPSASTAVDAPGGTAVTTIMGGVSRVMGTGLGNKRVILSITSTPFTHARPLFSLGDVMRAFQDAGAAPGRYVTQVQLPAVYDYVRQGVWIRHNWSLPLSILIDYSPAILTNVTLTGDGILTPRYYMSEGEKRVAGETTYRGLAEGTFTNGLRVQLKHNDIYSMSEAGGTKIDYSVTCLECDDVTLVVDGAGDPELINAGTVVNGGDASIPFTIRIDFTDKPLATLVTGHYQGHFSLLFEPNL